MPKQSCRKRLQIAEFYGESPVPNRALVSSLVQSMSQYQALAAAESPSSLAVQLLQ
jgi:hypothetical protein